MAKVTDFAKIVERIQRAGQQYNSSLQRIGDDLETLATLLQEALKGTGVWTYTAHGITLTLDGTPCSNVGCLGPAFWVDGEYGRSLLSTTGTPGSSTYLHGDFSVSVTRAGGKARREAAKRIPEFLASLAEYLEKSMEDAETAAAVAHAAAEAAEKALKAEEGSAD